MWMRRGAQAELLTPGTNRKPAVMIGLKTPDCTTRRGRSRVDSTLRATRNGEYTGGGGRPVLPTHEAAWL